MANLIQLAFAIAISLSVSLNYDLSVVAKLWLSSLGVYSKVNVTKSTQTNYRLYDSGKHLVLHCDTCSYVAGSGHLLGRFLGERIDSKSCVIRIGKQPISGFEDDVGWRTTVRIVNGASFGDAWKQLTNERIHSMPYFDENMINRTVFIQYDNFSNSDRDMALSIFTQLRIYEATDAKRKNVFEDFHRSTDNFATELSIDVWALNIIKDFCGVIHIYGMEDGASCSSEKRGKFEDLTKNYFDDSPLLCDTEQKENGLFETRKYFYKVFSENPNILFHAPRWK